MGSETMKNIDQMACEIRGFVKDLSEAIAADTGLDRKYRHIVVCGMGASAIGGEIISNSMYYSSKIDVTVAKTMALPYWTDKDTLYVICSYSGNTLETISMYELIRNSRSEMVVITAGGKLEELSLLNGNKMIKIGGKKMQPRSAIGWFIGILAAIIDDAGGPSLRDQIVGLIPAFNEFRQDLESEESISWITARKIDDKVPVIYSVPDVSSIALRWKEQINENSKRIAFSGVIPEFNHNEVVGWCSDNVRNMFVPVIITDCRSGVMFNTLNATINTLKDVGVEPIVVDIRGQTVLERSIYALMIGDHVSLCMAILSDVDPMDVGPITRIKGYLADYDCKKK